jgi:DNA polymerase-3 subunit epsilon
MSGNRQIFLDTETTGLSAENGDKILEIGCVELVNRQLTGNNLHFYINPERESHEDALKVHGISNEFLQDKPKFVQLSKEIVEYLSGADIFIHNAPFDVSFLDKELSVCGMQEFSTYVASITDTQTMAKQLFPGKRNSLDALCDRYGVDNSNRQLHGALLDAELLADVYICMTRGQDSLLMEATPSKEEGVSSVKSDLSSLKLPTIMASEQELTDHATVLKEIDKASSGKTVWNQAAVTSAS